MPSPFFMLVLNICLAGLVVAAAMCLYRLHIGPDSVDRAVAFDTLSSIFVGIICVLCMQWNTVLYFDAVWILMLLGFLGSTAIAKYLISGRVF